MGHYFAGPRGYRGFPVCEQGGAVPLLPPSCLRSHPSLCSPCTDAYTEAQQLPLEGTRPVGPTELEPRPAAISPPCYRAEVCTLRSHLPLLTCLFPLLSLRPLSGTWTQALGYSCLLLPSLPPEAGHPPPHTWSQQVLLSVRLVWAPPRDPYPVPSPVLGRLGLPPPQAWAIAHIPLLGEERGWGLECLCPWESKTPGAGLGQE